MEILREKAKAFTMYDSSISIVHWAFISCYHRNNVPWLEHAEKHWPCLCVGVFGAYLDSAPKMEANG